MREPDLPLETLRKLTDIFSSYKELQAVSLFGSRATGHATPRSDIDLVAYGIATDLRCGRLALDLDDLPIPQKCDLLTYESIRYPPLKRHIDRYGIIIYGRLPQEAAPSCAGIARWSAFSDQA